MNELPKIVAKSQKRKGRGYGSGKGGHTSGRGQKGQKSRGKINVLFEGMKMKKSFIKRLPIRRGREKFKAGKKPLVVNLNILGKFFPTGGKIDLDTVISSGLVNAVDAKKYGVKILGDGEVNKKFEIFLPISKSASEKVIKAGGKVTTK